MPTQQGLKFKISQSTPKKLSLPILLASNNIEAPNALDAWVTDHTYKKMFSNKIEFFFVVISYFNSLHQL